jgi:two-component system, NtrC family, response regulator AtoC
VVSMRDKVRGWLHREPKIVTPRTILIVDRDESNRSSTGRLVEALGYESLQAHSLAEALEQLEQQDPDTVLVGFELDDATGLEALDRLRELDADLPVIMLAANLWDTRVAEALRRGAVGYLARPFGQNDLRELLVRR